MEGLCSLKVEIQLLRSFLSLVCPLLKLWVSIQLKWAIASFLACDVRI
jgi:hypothetical protein